MKKADSLTDEEVLNSLANGKNMDASISQLYRSHFEVLSLYVINNNGSEADAEDIFQEVLIAFINLVKAGKFRGESGIRTFLYALNRNIWLNELKKRDRAQAREMNYEKGMNNPGKTMDIIISNRQTEKMLMKVVEQLGDNCRQILILFYYENKSMKEILATLHYENEQVVRNTKYKCLKKMEELVRANPSLFQQLKNYLHG